MRVTEDILIRTGKLRKLAGDTAATEAEAATAMEMAHKLLEAHNLDMSQVEEAHGKKAQRETVGAGTMLVGKWEVDLLNMIADYNYCKVLRAKRYSLTIIGRGTNVEAT